MAKIDLGMLKVSKELKDMEGLFEKIDKHLDVVPDNMGIITECETIRAFNEKYKGIASITYLEKERVYIFEYDEDVVCDSIELFVDGVIQFYDVVKYGVKAFLAFKNVNIKEFATKVYNKLRGENK